jgi:hypothetical protein
MPTLYSYDELITLFADNNARAITAEKLRDFVYTMKRPYGSIWWTTTAGTTISAAFNTGATNYNMVKAAGTTTANNLLDFTMPANNRLTYGGSPMVHTHIACSFTTTNTSNNADAYIGMAKNGSIIPHSIVYQRSSTGLDAVSTAFHSDVMVSQDDYLEVFVGSSSTGIVTVQRGYFFILTMMM